MGLIEWLRRKRQTDQEVRRECEAKIERHLSQQVDMAEEFYRFCHEGYKRGYSADLVITVDGVSSKIGVTMYSQSSRELFEYLVNWAARQKMEAVDRLETYQGRARMDKLIHAALIVAMQRAKKRSGGLRGFMESVFHTTPQKGFDIYRPFR